jgi:putative component of membrane protein insertase Oxa1/YidC/SpoIIIJ protein YidD
MPYGCNFRNGDDSYYRLRAVIRGVVCALLVYAVPACGHLKEKAHCPVEAVPPWILEVYRGPLNHLTAVRRGDCPMYPSCSEFSAQAIAKHGVMVGWMMTMDRLLRCGREELNLAPRVFDGGNLKAYDPVENNDFWWASPQKSDTP